MPSSDNKGACPGSTPMYPFLHGICASVAASRNTSRSGVATSRLNVSAISLCGSLHLLGLRQHIVDGALHIERLLGDLVVLPVGDLLEAADGVGELHVHTLEARKLFGYVE